MASLPTTNITTMMARNAIGESTNAVGALRTSTDNNWWGFKYPYVPNIQWGKAPLVPPYQLGDYREYEHDYLAVRFGGTQYGNTPEWFEDELEIEIETTKIRGYMVSPSPSYAHEYRVYGSAHVAQDGWTLLDTVPLVNDTTFVTASITFSDVPNLTAGGDTLYWKVEHYDSVGRRFDDDQSVWNDGNSYTDTYLTPAAMPDALVKLVSPTGAYCWWNNGNPQLIIDGWVIREYGADPDETFGAQYYFSGERDSGQGDFTGYSATVNVVGRDNDTSIYTTSTVSSTWFTIGATGYVDVNMVKPVGNLDPSVLRFSFTVSEFPPTI